MQPSTPCMVLNRIPVSMWVQRTSEKMEAANTEAPTDWRRFWLETYRELGGCSEESGSKRCPQAAAYALWFLGRLRGSGRVARQWPGPQVDQQLGKNAEYALIVAEMHQQHPTLAASRVWPLAQAEYEQQTGKEPAGSEQGQIRLVVALFREEQLLV